ncbi:DUF5799 family protein [Halobacterium jilantaiense]|uniref:Uncharacterized protein n=1 Tax=Halobacterium jilantaiense TaxID=355548 RepID=A0A1I0MUK9_9EURY|nr:DUF5799 family protein [Halobacterium jilantaiense]SEV92063.1 hypothetical protein SAMN04487945_0363 [Halobacterium jilantaiense]
MTDGWQDLIVGARMSVDQQFADRVQASGLSRPQWGLVMTAVEFEFEDADDPEAARIVANTSSLEHVLPEMDNVDQQMGGMGPGGDSSGGSGVVGGIKDALGIGGDDDDHEELADESQELAQAYADELQAFLEEEGRFEEVRRAAAGES